MKYKISAKYVLDNEGDKIEVLVDHGNLHLDDGEDGDYYTMSLSRQNVRDLLPIFVHFAETGELLMGRLMPGDEQLQARRHRLQLLEAYLDDAADEDEDEDW